MIPLGSLTDTERRLFGRLADGTPCPKADLLKELTEDMGAESLLSVHIYNLRKKLGRYGHSIMASGSNGRTSYRLVRFISAGE